MNVAWEMFYHKGMYANYRRAFFLSANRLHWVSENSKVF